MEIWIPLISACIGGLIATIPLLLGLIVQIYIHISEIRQKKKEAKTQLALELMRNDVRIVQEDIDNLLRSLDIIDGIRMKKEAKKITDDEMHAEMKSVVLDDNSKFSQLGELTSVAYKLAYYFGKDYFTEYKNLYDVYQEYLNYLANSLSYKMDELDKLDLKVLGSAAKLHTMLQEKLISVRE